METLHYFFRLLALSQVLLLCLYLLIYQRHSMGLLVALTLFSFGCYLISPFSDTLWGLGSVNLIVVLAASSIPSILWLLGRFFFCDDRRIPLWLWPLSLTYLLLGVPNWQAVQLVSDADISRILFDLLPQLIKLGLVTHVIYMALEGRASDMVTQRLKLRVPVAAGGGALASLVILVEIWSAGPMPMLIEVLGSLLMMVISVGANLFLLTLREDLPLAPVRAKPHLATDEVTKDNHAEIEKIQAAMTDSRFYANHGTTISELSELLSIVEYRLRGMINQELGYRNFNQFLNEYRIAEASARLISEPKLPIITIALDVGFKSLSSFNRAFRDKHQQTPSQYRSKPLNS